MRGLSSVDPVVARVVKGSVEVKRAKSQGNRWQTLKKGSAIEAGDMVRTGAQSRAELSLQDGSRVKVGSLSRLQVLQSAPSRLFHLAKGRVRAIVKKIRFNNKFEVRTPLAAASVRGTVFEMGFDEEKNQGYLEVDKGVVSLSQDGKDVDVLSGQRMDFQPDVPLGVPQDSSTQGNANPNSQSDRAALKREVGLGMSKEEVMAAAAEEIRLAEYQEGKTLIDVNGDRVRLEEYIIRRPAEVSATDRDKAFKLVVLNERDNRFDYFYYRGIFNQNLPDDLSVAFNDVRGKLDVVPQYYLTSYERAQANDTNDSVLDSASGGHLVTVTYDGTYYTLTDTSDPSHSTTILADDQSVVDGLIYHRVYDPIGDRFLSLTDAQYLAGDYRPTVYNASTEVFDVFGTANTFYRTSFNTYTHNLNGASKISYTPRSGITNILAQDLDASVTGGAILSFTQTPSGEDLLHNRVTILFSDGSTEIVNTYIISDDGKIGPVSAFAGITTGAAYKSELLNWNYEQVTESSVFSGRKIDLVMEPRILIKSGIIP